jgi:hypothetical protein
MFYTLDDCVEIFPQRLLMPCKSNVLPCKPFNERKTFDPPG